MTPTDRVDRCEASRAGDQPRAGSAAHRGGVRGRRSVGRRRRADRGHEDIPGIRRRAACRAWHHRSRRESRPRSGAKIREVARSLRPAPVLHWHFVGALQTNKCASVVTYASLVHSVDRLRLVTHSAAPQRTRASGSRAAVPMPRPGRPRRDLSTWSSRGAARGRRCDCRAVASQPSLELAGVMAVAPLGAEPGGAFATLASIADRVRQRHPAATVISAGMSGDLEPAVANGSTHVRVGAALLGSRRHPVG